MRHRWSRVRACVVVLLAVAVVSSPSAVAAARGRSADLTTRGAASEARAFLTQRATLAGSDTVTNDNFGFSIAISGSTAIVGAINHASGDGAAYVFVRSASGKWSQQAELHPPSFAAGGHFGFAVALDGNTAAVAAPDAESSGGVVSIYTRANGKWKLAATQASSAGVELGWSLGLSDGTLVAGGPGANLAFVFVRSGSTWPQRAVLTASDSGGSFGEAVAVTGTKAPLTVVVGAPGHASSAGSAYVFRGSGTSWTQAAELAPSGLASGDQFGWAVGASGTSLAIGAPQMQGTGVGVTYVYTASGSTFSQQAKLTPNDGVARGGFGEIVAIQGSDLVVGAPLEGSVYAYTRSPGKWSLRAELVRSGLFGDSLGIAAGTLVVGDPSVNASGGVAYVFSIS